EARLLALLGARIARQEATALEVRAQLGVDLDQGAGDSVPQCIRLRGNAAAVDLGHDVHRLLVAGGLERLACAVLERRAREVGLERAAVDRVLALAGAEDHARDRRLALAGCAVTGLGGQLYR